LQELKCAYLVIAGMGCDLHQNREKRLILFITESIQKLGLRLLSVFNDWLWSRRQ